jgi:NADH-quinone oxidoreductase subunit L
MRIGSPTLALIVLGLPFLSFLVLGLVRPLRRSGRPAGVFSTTAIGLALATAYLTFHGSVPRTPLQSPSATWSWIPADGGPMATVGVLVDDYSMAMLMLVTLVSFLVQLYSLGYLHDESAPGLGRYYAYQSLFAFSMLGLVLAPGFLQMFIFWELVGLCSYLLIGFWYTKPSAAKAAVKAFWITKLGDLGFVTGIVMLWVNTGTFDFGELARMTATGSLPFAGFSTIMFLIYLGAVGKSAQFPLHVWLPDAMEGPTPVSALIHAATMVTAGVYMVTRAFFLFALAPDVMTIIAWVGAFTALLAATMACVESDIKRVLAYSTVSQLGYMMAAAGAGAPDASFSHLLYHGVFKALLFLGAGAVIHVFHTNDMFRMGGLYRTLPWVGLPFLAATLALAGVYPFPGYFSKEAILGGVIEAGLIGPFVMLALTAFLTSFYMFRVVFLVFFCAPIPATPHGQAHAGAPHVPWQMDAVCRALGVLTVALGLWLAVAGHHGEGPGWLPAASLTLVGCGFLLALLAYQRRVIDPANIAALLRPIDVLARRRYFLDALYGAIYRGALLAFSRLIGWIDRYLVDGLLNVVSASALRAGDQLRRIQSGQPQDYVYGVALGVLGLIVWAQWWAK